MFSLLKIGFLYQYIFLSSACPYGYFGVHCSHLCGMCMNGCHNVNGTCVGGCGPGYQGDRCTNPCDQGYYGAGCRDTCGYCRDGATCDTVTGACPPVSVCQPGWNGSLCKTVTGFSKSGVWYRNAIHDNSFEQGVAFGCGVSGGFLVLVAGLLFIFWRNSIVCFSKRKAVNPTVESTCSCPSTIPGSLCEEMSAREGIVHQDIPSPWYEKLGQRGPGDRQSYEDTYVHI